MSEQQRSEKSETDIVVKRSARSRAGCAFLVLLWCMFLLLPGLCFVLAIQGEIALWYGGGIPEPESHPMVQVKLVMDADSRGLNITRSSVAISDETQSCVQTDVSFLLWQGEGDPASYCECYIRDGEQWVYEGSMQGACE